MTQWVHAKQDKLVTSLSQLPVNYYKHRVNVCITFYFAVNLPIHCSNDDDGIDDDDDDDDDDSNNNVTPTIMDKILTSSYVLASNKKINN